MSAAAQPGRAKARTAALGTRQLAIRTDSQHPSDKARVRQLFKGTRAIFRHSRDGPAGMQATSRSLL